MKDQSAALLETPKRYVYLRSVSHPVLDEILQIQDPLDQLREVCRALLILEELETAVRSSDSSTTASLLIRLDSFRSNLTPNAHGCNAGKCSSVEPRSRSVQSFTPNGDITKQVPVNDCTRNREKADRQKH